MNFDYDNIAEVADELLAEFGQACVLTAITDGAYDPETGEAGTSTTTHPVTAAILSYKQGFIDGTLIRTGDKRVLMTAVGLAVDPKEGDTLTDARSRVYKVVTAKDLAPGDVNVLWTLQVRK